MILWQIGKKNLEKITEPWHSYLSKTCWAFIFFSFTNSWPFLSRKVLGLGPVPETTGAPLLCSWAQWVGLESSSNSFHLLLWRPSVQFKCDMKTRQRYVQQQSSTEKIIHWTLQKNWWQNQSLFFLILKKKKKKKAVRKFGHVIILGKIAILVLM